MEAEEREEEINKMGGDRTRWSETNFFEINKMIVDEPLQVCSRF